MRDDPAAALLAEPERQPQAALGVDGQLLGTPAAQERVGEGDVRPGRHVESDELERGAVRLPAKNGGHVSR